MAAAKTERLMNLLIMLLVQRGYVSRDRIRELLYPGSSDEAFERMFERDKDELRSLGVPIEVGTIDPLFEDEQGYRISPDDYALPAIELSADEAAVVGLAGSVWEHARLAEATTEALRKLTAAGADIDVTALDIVQPRIAAEEPAFDVFFEAVQSRTPVRFAYRRMPAEEPTTRRLEPWGVFRYRGRWYAVGHDLDRQDERIFRLSRVVGDVQLAGPPESYAIPADVDVREVARTLRPEPRDSSATVLVRAGTCLSLRRSAATVEEGVTGPDDRTRWDRLVIEHAPLDLAGEVLSQGPDVVVEEPAELRESVLTCLSALVEAAS